MNRDERDFVAIRFGLGPARSGEDWSPGAQIVALQHADPNHLLKLPTAAQRYSEFNDTVGPRPENLAGATKKEYKKRRGYFRLSAYRADVQQRIKWAVQTQLPLVERLLAFWSNHFTVSQAKSTVRMLVGPYETEALLPYIGGRFADLLQAAEKHPAMLIYLDQIHSIGPNSPAGQQRAKTGLNENLAREILELHTLGVHGGYTQTDVTEFAKLMTGWSVDELTGEATYRPKTAEPGSKTILGRRYGGAEAKGSDFGDMLDQLAVHPATARHIATKLVTHFISDSPPAAAVSAVEAAFMGSGGNLPDVYRTLMSLPEANSRPGTKARTDRDFLIAALRAADVPDKKIGGEGHYRLSVRALNQAGQKYWSAASPAGWPEAADKWLSPSKLAGRLEMVQSIVAVSAVKAPDDLMQRALGSFVSERTSGVIKAASNREEGMALVLASPEFNRR